MTSSVPEADTSPEMLTSEPEHTPGPQQFQLTKNFGFLPIPFRLRYDPQKPPHFGMALNIAFGFASTFVVANLYYCQPLLIQLSIAFNVTYSEVSLIPTLVQTGYVTGIILISPLGDILHRRSLILFIVAVSTCLIVGLALTSSLVVFEILSFCVGVFNVTPQILVPLTADLAPEKQRASAISVVASGMLFGVLLARVIAGVITEFVSWRVVYYFSIGVQAMVLAGCYFILPNYPSKNRDLTYFNILSSMSKFAITEPILIQACLVNVAANACFSNFWVTLTFLLGGPPYHYPTLVIGLFGLVGLTGVAGMPFMGYFIDRLVPWYASLLAILMLLVFQSVQTGAGGVNVGAVIVATFGLDAFAQMLSLSLTTAVLGISISARSRLNAVFVVSTFIGQAIGSSVGSYIFVNFGWRAAALFSMGLFVFQLFILLLRGPHCDRYTWSGYEGGLEPRKSIVQVRKLRAEDKEVARADNADTQPASRGVDK